MKRKSPIKHKVRSHTRKGKKVQTYDRGHGTKKTVLWKNSKGKTDFNKSLIKQIIRSKKKHKIGDIVYFLNLDGVGLVVGYATMKQADVFHKKLTGISIHDTIHPPKPNEPVYMIMIHGEKQPIPENELYLRREQTKHPILKDPINIRTEEMVEDAMELGISDPDFYNWANEGMEEERLDVLAKKYKVTKSSMNKLLMEDQ